MGYNNPIYKGYQFLDIDIYTHLFIIESLVLHFNSL